MSLIKYITKRGGTMNFDSKFEEPKEVFCFLFLFNLCVNFGSTLMFCALLLKVNYNMHELESLGRALDMHKSLANEAHVIHSKITKQSVKKNEKTNIHYHDAEVCFQIFNSS
jgi:hypothetical protein